MKEGRKRLGDAIDLILERRRQMDPTESVPTYDLHLHDGSNTAYVLVRGDWLDAIWNRAHGVDSDKGIVPMMPHEHIDPTDFP